MTNDVNGQDEAGSTADERERDTGSRFRRRTAIKTLGMANLAGLTGLAGCMDTEEIESEAEDVQKEVESEAEEITTEARPELESDNYSFIISAFFPTMTTTDEDFKLITPKNNNTGNINLEDNNALAKISSPDMILHHIEREIPVKFVLSTPAPEVDGVDVTVEADAKTDRGITYAKACNISMTLSGDDIESEKGTLISRPQSTTDGGLDSVTDRVTDAVPDGVLDPCHDLNEEKGAVVIDYSGGAGARMISLELTVTFDFTDSTVFRFNENFDGVFSQTYEAWVPISPLQKAARKTFRTAADARELAEGTLGPFASQNTEPASKAGQAFVLTSFGLSNDKNIEQGEMQKNVITNGIGGISKTIDDAIDQKQKESSEYSVRPLGPTLSYNGEDLSTSTKQAESNTEDAQKNQNTGADSGFTTDFEYSVSPLEKGWANVSKTADPVVENSSLTINENIKRGNAIFAHSQNLATGTFRLQGVQNSERYYGMRIDFISQERDNVRGYTILIAQQRSRYGQVRLIRKDRNDSTELAVIEPNHQGREFDLNISRDSTGTFEITYSDDARSKTVTVTDQTYTSSSFMRVNLGEPNQKIDRIEITE